MERAWISVCLILIVHSRSVYARYEIEVKALLEFKYNLDMNGGAVLSSWIHGSSGGAPCDWYRIDCDFDGHVFGIYLGGVGIGGPINGDALAKLPKLNHLDLSYNTMRGPIPKAFENIGFNRLVLNHNKINGFIPCSLGKTHPIQYTINLEYNELQGCIPPQLLHNKDYYFVKGNPNLHVNCAKS